MRALFIVVAFLVTAHAANQAPLIDTARRGDSDALRRLLRTKVDVNAAEADGATALHWVTYHDDVQGAAELVRAGADVNAANDLGVTALWNACLNGSSGMVRLLLQAGARPNA